MACANSAGQVGVMQLERVHSYRVLNYNCKVCVVIAPVKGIVVDTYQSAYYSRSCTDVTPKNVLSTVFMLSNRKLS